MFVGTKIVKFYGATEVDEMKITEAMEDLLRASNEHSQGLIIDHVGVAPFEHQYQKGVIITLVAR